MQLPAYSNKWATWYAYHSTIQSSYQFINARFRFKLTNNSKFSSDRIFGKSTISRINFMGGGIKFWWDVNVRLWSLNLTLAPDRRPAIDHLKIRNYEPNYHHISGKELLLFLPSYSKLNVDCSKLAALLFLSLIAGTGNDRVQTNPCCLHVGGFDNFWSTW